MHNCTRDLSAQPLMALEIPDAVPIPRGYPEAALWGVGAAAINDGLRVFIEAWPTMAPGDKADVFWNDTVTSVASVTITADILNQRVGLIIPGDTFVAGDVKPSWRLSRVSGGTEDAPARDIRVKLDTPGGANPDPSTPHNGNLAAPQLPADIGAAGLDAARAAQGVDVTLPAWPGMADYDVVDFSWGGQHIQTIVQPGEAGKPVVIPVTQAQILAAGDGDILLMYQLTDCAANRSDGWSLVTALNVSASGTGLPAPVITGAADGTLDSSTLTGPVTVQVITRQDDFAAGDTVTLTWSARAADGGSVDWTGTQTVTVVPSALLFQVPVTNVAAAAGGFALVSYTLSRAGSADRVSQRATVLVSGTAVQLPAPTVSEATGGVLPADVAQATVIVPAWPGMGAGDLVTLVWGGTTATGAPTDWRCEHTVSNAGVGQPVNFTVPAAQVALLDGGSVSVRYEVGLADGSATSISAPLALTVGQAHGSDLPAPTVDQAQNGALPVDLTLADVRIAPYSGMAAGDKVTLSWVGDSTGPFTDFIPVTAGTAGHTLDFTVPAAHIAGNTTVTVGYTVDRNATFLHSALLTLRVGVQAALPAPLITEADGSTLSVTAVANNASVVVPAGANLTAGDLVTVTVSGTDGDHSYEHAVSGIQAGQAVTVMVPQTVIAASTGGTLTVGYSVVRAAGGTETSDTVTYTVSQGEAALPAPVVSEAQNGILDPASPQATVMVPAYDQMAAGDTVTVNWTGDVTGPYSDWIPVSATTAGNPLPFVIEAKDIAGNTTVSVYYTVETASGAKKQSATLTLKTVLPQALPAPVVSEAQGGYIDPASPKATVVVPAYGQMAAGDTVTVNWTGDVTGPYSDWVPVSAATAGAPLPFIIEAKDIAGNTTVSVYYTVNRNTGGVVENSAIAEFQVGSSGEDIANTVPVAVEATGNNGTLLQKSDYYRLDELTIKVPAYKGMAVNDTVKVYWIGRNYTYGSDIETVGVAGDITFTIPRMEFIDTIGGSANIYFTVQKHGTDEIINSASLWLQVQGQSLELPAPDVSDDLLVVTVIYPGMSSDDRVQVRVAGKNINDTDLKEGNGSNRLVFTIDKSWLERDTRGALLYNYAVGVNGGEYEFSRVTRIS